MGRLYAVCFENVAVTAAQDLLYIAPADDKPCIIHEIRLSQSTEIKDAEEEQLRLKLVRGHSTVGSDGSAVTPTPLNPSDAAASFTARRNDTTIASSGTAVDLLADTMNVRSGWLWLPTPECRPVVSQGAGVTIVLRLMANPADSVTMGGTMIVEEIG